MQRTDTRRHPVSGGDVLRVVQVRRINGSVIELVLEGPPATLVAILDDSVPRAMDTEGRPQAA